MWNTRWVEQRDWHKAGELWTGFLNHSKVAPPTGVWALPHRQLIKKRLLKTRLWVNWWSPYRTWCFSSQMTSSWEKLTTQTRSWHHALFWDSFVHLVEATKFKSSLEFVAFKDSCLICLETHTTSYMLAYSHPNISMS